MYLPVLLVTIYKDALNELLINTAAGPTLNIKGLCM